MAPPGPPSRVHRRPLPRLYTLYLSALPHLFRPVVRLQIAQGALFEA